MYFSRVTLVPQLIPRKTLMKLFNGNSYSDHQLLWRLFDDEKRQFIFRREQGTEQPYAAIGQNSSLPVYYVVSKYAPVACDELQVLSKPYEPKLLAGEQFGFSLRANPIVAKRVEGKKNSVHHDVLMDAKNKGKEQGLSAAQRGDAIEQAGKDWLLGRAQNLGFSLDDNTLVCDGYQQHRFYKVRGKKPISYSTLDYNGILTITDPEKFANHLFNGVGRAKAFGCGLMMIRRV